MLRNRSFTFLALMRNMAANHHKYSESITNMGVLQVFEQMLARDKALSEKIASVIDLDKLLKPNPKMSELIDKLFEHNEAAEKWTEYLQNTLYGKLRHTIDGASVNDEYEEPEPSDIVIDAIEDRVTEINEPAAQRRHLRITREGLLVDQDDPSKTHPLSPQMQRLLSSLNKTYQKTKALCEDSGYKSEPAFYDAIRRLNRIGFHKLKLATKISISERTLGFRLAKYISIEVDKQNPNI